MPEVILLNAEDLWGNIIVFQYEIKTSALHEKSIAREIMPVGKITIKKQCDPLFYQHYPRRRSLG